MSKQRHDPLAWIDEELAALDAAGLRRRPGVRSGPQAARLVIDDRQLVNFGSNDYLAIAADPYDAAIQKRGPNQLFTRAGVIAHSLFCMPPDYDLDAWSDEAEGIDYEHLESITRTIHAAVSAVADGSITPERKSGGRGGDRKSRRTNDERR